MDPDILCPAQVIPVGFKGTAARVGAPRSTRLLLVCVGRNQNPETRASLKRDKVNLRGTFAAVARRRLYAFFLAGIFPPRPPPRDTSHSDNALTRHD